MLLLVSDPSWTLEEHTHCFHVFDGDAFLMFDSCQDDFEHAVMKAEGPSNNGARVSIVFKKSLPRLGGRRGHGVRLSSPSVRPNSNSAQGAHLTRKKR